MGAMYPAVLVGVNTLFHRDAGSLVYPNLLFLRECLLQGQIPFWNPYSHCGVPFLAQLGSLYPGNLAFILLPMPWAFNCSTILHLVLGGAGAYFLARKWKFSELGCQVAGTSYAFSGLALSCMQWNNYTASLGWLPWVIYYTVAAYEMGGVHIYIAALIASMQVLTATPELTVLTWVALLLGLSFKFSWSGLKRLSIVILLIIGLTAVQILPFLELLSHGQRSNQFDTGIWSLPLTGLANFILPNFHYYISTQNLWFQTGQEFMRSYYLGLITLGLSILGLRYSSRKWQMVGLFSAACLVLALGVNGHAYAWLKAACPFIGFARFPVKFCLIVGFTIPMLAGLGATKLQQFNYRKPLLAIFTGLLFVLVLLAFNNQSQIPGYGTILITGLLALLALVWWGKLWVLPLLIAVDGYLCIPNINPTLPSAVLQGNMWLASNPHIPTLAEGRVISSPAALRQFNTYQVPDIRQDFISRRAGEWYNLNLLDRVPKVDGAIVIRPKWFDDVEQQLYYKTNNRVGIGLLDFLSATYISDSKSPVLWSQRPSARPLVTGGQQAKLIPETDILSAISAADFNPAISVYFPMETTGILATNASTCTISNANITLNHISFSTTSATTSMVTISETYYHWWHAFIDGRQVPLYRANHAFQAMQVPPGIHNVEIIYQDRLFTVSLAISIVTLSVCTLGILKKRKSFAKPPKTT